MTPVKQTNEMVQNTRLCTLSLRAIPGRPCVDVFKLNSWMIERRRRIFFSSFGVARGLVNAIGFFDISATTAVWIGVSFGGGAKCTPSLVFDIASMLLASDLSMESHLGLFVNHFSFERKKRNDH